MYTGEGDSTQVPWASVNQLKPSKVLYFIYDTHSNYLDFLNIDFEHGKNIKMHRFKSCALNPRFKASHRWIADLLGIDY